MMVAPQTRKLNKKIDRLKYLEKAMPKARGLGSSFKLENTIEYPFYKLILKGNTEQATNIITYTCAGTESGDYYFVYDSINYQFTMPTVSSEDVIYFNTDTLKLYLSQTEIQTTTASTGTLITMINTPNPSYPQNIKVVTGENNIKEQNKNIFDKDDTGIIYNTRLTNSGDTTPIGDVDAVGYYVSNYISIQQNRDIVTNEDLTYPIKAALYDKDKNFIQIYSSETTSFNTNNASYIRIGGKTDLINEKQVEYGITSTSYVSHQEQNYAINLGNNYLASNPDRTIRDEIVGTPNNWKINRKIRKYTFTGQENFYYDSNSNRFVVDNLIDSKHVSGRQSLVCNRFKFIASGSTDYGIFAGWNGAMTQLFIYDKDFTRSTDLKNYLANNNTYIYYPLNTPIEEPISDTTLIKQLNKIYEKMIAYDEETNIETTWSEGNVPFIIEAEAISNDYDSRITALEEAILSQGANV